MKKSIRIANCFIEKDLKNMLRSHVAREHFLFISSSGTGKTTLLQAMVQDTPNCEPIYVNPQEVNVQWIRKKFISIVKGNTVKQKVLVFDEFDLLLESSQHLIATILEETSCLFYATCCDPHKIIPGIRAKCMTIRIPPLSNTLLRRAFAVFFKEFHSRSPSEKEEESVLTYCEGNLTKMRLGIERLHDTDTLTDSLDGQSFIDKLYMYITTFSTMDVHQQVKQLAIIQKYLHMYYEENHPHLWEQFQKEIHVSYN